MITRQRIYEIVNPSEKHDLASRIYDIFIILVVLVSLSSLAFINDKQPWLYTLDFCAAIVFIIDYVLRWITADLKLKKGWKSFILYPFTLMAIFDLLSIIPGIFMFGNGLQILRTLRFLRLFRTFKLIRYSRELTALFHVFQKQKGTLISVAVFVLVYILMVALVMFSFEPETFGSFFNAIYWSAISVTTVGYGDFAPVSDLGRVINIISALVSVIIIALPVSIVTAGYIQEIGLVSGKDKSEAKEKTPEVPAEIDPESVSGQGEERPKYCSHCGAKVEDGAIFCHKCGKKL